MVGAGLALGLVVSVFGTRLVQGLLFETDPLDPAAPGVPGRIALQA